ncbi:porin family protein [Flavobacterium xanthum]|uniref:Outer membrane protein beta-barrel domain-containing protein n=1 Tax=Flavobacterium xanthum TaxID=69322 RepID=A0A1M7GP45_9FLAO|nr:porin family protein [Flavobacterium xanthum]SHM17908.1 Outer membrane protein beta-barrel domain-containing protein [Flavobacterium xanthum]
MKNSKNLIFASAVLGLMSFTGMQAQEKIASYGFKGGLNFSNLYTDTVDDNNVLTGFNAGLYAKFPITNSIAIQPEINYTTKGAELVYNNAIVQGTAKFNVNYIEVPILLVANITENFNVHVGPYAAYMVSGKTTNDSNFSSSQRELDTNDFNKFDAGISGGVGIDLDAVNFGVRYNYGLTKIGKDDSSSNFISSDAKNSVLNVYVGLRLN